MSPIDAIDSALTGLHREATRLDETARRVAQDGASAYPEAGVEQIRSLAAVKANAAVVRAAREMQDTLLDLFA